MDCFPQTLFSSPQLGGVPHLSPHPKLSTLPWTSSELPLLLPSSQIRGSPTCAARSPPFQILSAESLPLILREAYVFHLGELFASHPTPET